MPITTQSLAKILILSPILLPDSRCVICSKTICDISGRRITAQQVRGVALSNKYRGGGNAEFPYKSFKFGSTGLFLRVWGAKYQCGLMKLFRGH